MMPRSKLRPLSNLVNYPRWPPKWPLIKPPKHRFVQKFEIQIRLVHTLRLIKIKERKIYLLGARKPPLPTRLFLTVVVVLMSTFENIFNSDYNF